MEHNLLDHVRSGWQNKKTPILVVGGVVIGILFLISAGTFAYVKAYEGKIYPNVWIDSMNVGGMTQEEAYQLVDEQLQTMLDDGLVVEVEGQTLTIDLRASGADDPDLISDRLYVDVDGVVEEAYNVARSDRPIFDALSAVFLAIDNNVALFPEVTVLEDELEETIRELLVARELDVLEEPGEPTHYDAYYEGHTIAIEIIEGTPGTIFDFETFFADLESAAQNFAVDSIKLALIEQSVDVSEEEAGRELTVELRDILWYAPYELTHTSQSYRDYSWEIDFDDLVAWLIPAWEDDELVLALAGEGFEDFIEEIHETVDVEPVDARFTIEGDRVTEFSGSQSGVTFDEEATIEALADVWGEHIEEYHGDLNSEERIAGPDDNPVPVEIVTMETEADVTTDSVNNLGINEILGVGISDFSGSPANRVSNIRHGASKLNGILLAPGETLSLIDELGPFTVADGYLPELVIKGDEIKPEVGGGLCQIGTTTFRATMNAGLEVVERRNHSLVVSYYNDPSNGNPGTDATIYDPAPDYKMRNDTDNYVLLTTEVDLYNYELIFTFWGTSDGREGYYTAPVILSWTGYGETEYIETLDLAPGEEQCQSPHPGATASFTYYVDYEEGEQHAKTYTSTYRSLPWICLVGVEELSCNPDEEECPEDTGEDTDEDAEGDETDEDPEGDGDAEEAEEDTADEESSIDEDEA